MSTLYSTEEPVTSATFGPQSLGTLITTDTYGDVTAIRYWANPQSTGLVIQAGLYFQDGTLLKTGSRLQASSDVPGWVEIPLSSPVHIGPGNTYIPAYNPGGYRMSCTIGGFASPRDNGHLHAIASACRQHTNEVSPDLSFPDQAVQFDPTNDYFIDLVFVAGEGANAAPTANAGFDQINIEPGSTVTVTGSGFDVDGSIASYSWRQISGLPVTLSSPHSASTTFVAPDSSSGTVIVLGLVVTDNFGLSSTEDTVSITVLTSTEFIASGSSWVPLDTSLL